MGQDKSQLQIRKQISQLDYLWELVNPLVEQCFVSVAHQTQPAHSYPFIQDKESNQGPLGGIISALTAHPNAAFLVVACDLPLLNETTLKNLISQRNISTVTNTNTNTSAANNQSDINTTAEITCYLNAHDHRPEPLCAIYEPSALKNLVTSLDNQLYCARKVVENSNYLSLNLTESYALNNANTPQDLAETQAFLTQAPMEKTLHIHYFAQLKSLANKTEESVLSYSATPAGIYDELKMKYKFKFKASQLKVAINDEFCDWDTALKDQDKIVFMPPVTGG